MTSNNKMKFAVVLCVLLPVALSAHIGEKRFIEEVLGGYDILDLAKQTLAQFGKDETEHQCEISICPSVIGPVTGPYQQYLCAAVCKQAQVLAQAYLSTGSPLFPVVTATASPGGK